MGGRAKAETFLVPVVYLCPAAAPGLSGFELSSSDSRFHLAAAESHFLSVSKTKILCNEFTRTHTSTHASQTHTHACTQTHSCASTYVHTDTDIYTL